jgi:hypothetical protein
MMTPKTKSKVSWIYSTIKCFCKRHPQYTVRAIRHSIFFEDTNGLKESGAIVRNGGRILIHEERFFAWIEKRSLEGDV